MTVVALLLGLQMGNTICFFCLLDSWDDRDDFKIKERPPRDAYVMGKHTVSCKVLADRNKIYLPPSQIELGRIKNLLKAVNFKGEDFAPILSCS